MGYITLSDYRSYIQPTYFTQLLQADDSKRIIAESEALAIIKGKIEQRFDVSTEFSQTLPFSFAKIYGVRDRVILDFPAYDATLTYALNALTVFRGMAYYCTTAIVSPEAFTIGHWTALGAQYSLFFVSYPPTCTYQPNFAAPNTPVFNLYAFYNKGDIVWWKGYLYTCAQSTIMIGPGDLKRYYQYKNVPNYNVFPDDAVNNNIGQFWNNKTPYTLTAGTLPTAAYAVYNPASTYALGALMTYNGNSYINTTAITTPEAFNPQHWNVVSPPWTAGDNRDQQLTMAMKAIVIYNLSPLLSPRNTVTEWCDRYDSAMHVLREMAEGNITVDIPQIQPSAGMMTSYGGNVKLRNRYILVFFISKLIAICLM